MGRRWDAPPGTNLLASLCFDDVPSVAAELTQAVGLAAVRAVDRLEEVGLSPAERPRAGLKWPNDVLLGGRKLAGVLAQRSPQGPVVVGIGLNVKWAPDGVACLATDLGVDTDPAAVLESLLCELDQLLAMGSDQRHRAYVERLDTLGRVVRIQRPAGDDLLGVAVGVDPTGRLRVQPDGPDDDVVAVDVGDIVHLRTRSTEQ